MFSDRVTAMVIRSPPRLPPKLLKSSDVSMSRPCVQAVYRRLSMSKAMKRPSKQPEVSAKRFVEANRTLSTSTV